MKMKYFFKYDTLFCLKQYYTIFWKFKFAQM